MKKILIFTLLLLTILPQDVFAMNYRPKGMSYIYENNGKTYRMESKDFNMICESPCPFRKIDQKKMFESMKSDFQKFEEIAGNPIPESLKPIDVHINIGKTCEDIYPAERRKVDNAGSYAPIVNGKGVICMYHYSTNEYLKNTTALFHELAHFFFQLPRAPKGEFDVEHSIVSVFGRNFKNEKAQAPLIIKRKRKNGVWIDYVKNPEAIVKREFATMCSPLMEKVSAPSYEICKKYTFDFHNIPDLIKRTQELKAEGKMTTREDLLNLIIEIGSSNTEFGSY